MIKRVLKLEKQNILLVGSTNSGKTFFAKNIIIPLLEEKGRKVAYFENCDCIDHKSDADIFIVDEVELLFDKIFLEKRHPEEKPYYNEYYLKKVKERQKKLSKISKQIICIVTRNNQEEIDYLIKNYKKLEWNDLPVEVVKFERDCLCFILNK